MGRPACDGARSVGNIVVDTIGGVNDSFKIPNKDNSISPKTVVEFPQRRQLNIPKNAS